MNKSQQSETVLAPSSTTAAVAKVEDKSSRQYFRVTNEDLVNQKQRLKKPRVSSAALAYRETEEIELEPPKRKPSLDLTTVMVDVIHQRRESGWHDQNGYSSVDEASNYSTASQWREDEE